MRSPYPDLMLEMAVVRMASLAAVIDADELMRAIGASGSAAGVGNSTSGKPPGGGGGAAERRRRSRVERAVGGARRGCASRAR